MRNSVRKLAIVVAALTSFLALRCNGESHGVQGTYSDGPGTLILELRSGGKAEITDHGESEQCNYNVTGKQLTLDCKGQWGKTVFAIHDDQSLTVTGSAFPLPALRKQK